MAAARPERRYVRLMDAPDVWGLSTDTIYRARARGELHIYKPVGVALLKLSEVDAWGGEPHRQ